MSNGNLQPAVVEMTELEWYRQQYQHCREQLQQLQYSLNAIQHDLGAALRDYPMASPVGVGSQDVVVHKTVEPTYSHKLKRYFVYDEALKQIVDTTTEYICDLRQSPQILTSPDLAILFATILTQYQDEPFAALADELKLHGLPIPLGDPRYQFIPESESRKLREAANVTR